MANSKEYERIDAVTKVKDIGDFSLVQKDVMVQYVSIECNLAMFRSLE